MDTLSDALHLFRYKDEWLTGSPNLRSGAVKLTWPHRERHPNPLSDKVMPFMQGQVSVEEVEWFPVILWDGCIVTLWAWEVAHPQHADHPARLVCQLSSIFPDRAVRSSTEVRERRHYLQNQGWDYNSYESRLSRLIDFDDPRFRFVQVEIPRHM